MDLNDPKDVKTKREAALRFQYDRREALKSIMASHEGRRWVFDLLAYCQLFRSPYNASPIAMSHNIGRGDAGRFVYDQIIETCPDKFLLMMKEHENDRHADNDKSRLGSVPGPEVLTEPGLEGYLYEAGRGVEGDDETGSEG